jgi:acyl-[acyl-carrier-protein]-phospholipid O-acyltransferase/long-chain-fatty-acid--[acyl-carrier-protein] ligase
VKVEELVSKLVEGAPCAVTGIPDERKGERLAVLYTAPGVAPETIWRGLSEAGLPNLWVPKLENIHQVDTLPVLGTGKLDLRGVRARALELASAPRAR